MKNMNECKTNIVWRKVLILKYLKKSFFESLGVRTKEKPRAEVVHIKMYDLLYTAAPIWRPLELLKLLPLLPYQMHFLLHMIPFFFQL